MLFSAQTKGFYLPELHGDGIPDDVVEITDEEHAALIAAQGAGQVIAVGADGKPVAQERPALAGAELERVLLRAVQRHLDAQARALGYDGIAAAVSYADEPAVARYQAEGQALRAWRSKVWEAALAAQGSVKTPEDLLATLPIFDAAVAQ